MATLIEPSTFDIIVLGTGLPQCIVAAAAASNGHSVLHLDTCDFYGSHWASLPLHDFRDWCQAAGQLPFPSSSQVPATIATSVVPQSDAPDGLHGLSGIETADHAEDFSSAENEKRESTSGTVPDNVSHDRAARDTSSDLSSAEEDGMQTQTDEFQDAPDVNAQSCAENSSFLSKNSSETQEHGLMHDTSGSSPSDVEELGIEPVLVQQNASMYSRFEASSCSVDTLGPSRSFSIDLTGPKLAYCAEPLVDLVMNSGASNYLEFKSLEASFIWNGGELLPVPASRADVFKDRTLTNAEKRHLMRFFKLVADYTSSDADITQISQEELESPFIDFLQGRQIPSSVQAMILYAIALSDYEQHSSENIHDHLMSTKKGVESLALYFKSVGRFPNSTGAFLYPLYGQGELPQAFSRSAAVKGALYALKMPVHSLLKDKETGNFKGLQMSTRQLIFSERLVVGPTMCSTLCKFFSSELTAEDGGGCCTTEGKKDSVKVARGVCLSDGSLRPDVCTIMVVFPPHSITEQENGVIRVVQLGNSVSVCPEGKYLVQLSMACSDENAGIEALQKATELLFQSQDSSSLAEEHRPTLLWAAFYAHDVMFSEGVKWFSAGQIAAFGMPDETLHYQNAVASAENVYKCLYPEDLFFPRPPPSVRDDSEVDNVVANGYIQEVSQML